MCLVLWGHFYFHNLKHRLIDVGFGIHVMEPIADELENTRFFGGHGHFRVVPLGLGELGLFEIHYRLYCTIEWIYIIAFQFYQGTYGSWKLRFHLRLRRNPLTPPFITKFSTAIGFTDIACGYAAYGRIASKTSSLAGCATL